MAFTNNTNNTTTGNKRPEKKPAAATKGRNGYKGRPVPRGPRPAPPAAALKKAAGWQAFSKEEPITYAADAEAAWAARNSEKENAGAVAKPRPEQKINEVFKQRKVAAPEEPKERKVAVPPHLRAKGN